MSGRFFLDWAIMALSLFNTILLLWLGLTVLLNADRRPARRAGSRRWGIWLAAGGLLTGSAFFVSHSAILGRGLFHVSHGMNLWWQAGWVAIVVLPLAWYLVMLWYAGYWEGRQGSLRRRQRPWFFLVGLLALGLVGLFVFASPLPAYWQLMRLDLTAQPSVRGVPLLILVYPLYTILCIALSLDVLRRPEPSGRVMGDLARQRARPWLVAASVTLLIVSLLVAWVLLWLVVNLRWPALFEVPIDVTLQMAWFDLVLSLLIAVSVVLLGQAVVSYEVFTGKALPRRGLIRHWRWAVILAAGYGLVVGASLVVQLRAVYGLLVTALLMTLFYALLSWRSYAERERYIDHLRPFVASQRLYERLLTPSDSGAGGVDVTVLFHALCADVLGARSAYLVPLGPSTPLVGAALAFPAADSSPPSLSGVVGQFVSPQSMCVPLDEQPAMWAVPLWSERGLIGALLLGEKRDGGLYTQEEIEVARASGERLMDALVSTEMARRLMALQRQRLAESQVLDQKTRRTLHDDVLPLLHTALLSLGSEGQNSEAASLLVDAHRQISDLLHEMPAPAAAEVERLGLFGALRRVVDDELAGAFDGVVWQIAPEAEQALRAVPSLAREVLFYAGREVIRNAARHGREGDNSLHLCVAVTCCQPEPSSGQGGLEILIEDDGAGFGPLDAATDSGGQGLALHSTMMAVVGGTLAVDSLPGAGTRVRLALPGSILQDNGG